MSISKLIIGLGNPGRKYDYTRHNCGWLVLEALAQELSPLYEAEKWSGLLGEKGSLGLFKPLTYVNKSGVAVSKALRALDLNICDLLVICDDFNLELGRIRMRPSGSSGGHNGLQSVIDHLGGEGFARLRIGIGPVPEQIPVRAFVLSRFQSSEEETLDRVVRAGRDAALCWVSQGTGEAMGAFNGWVGSDNG